MSDDDPDEDLGDNYFLMFDDKEGLDEAESIIAAVECLSPAVRELLVTNPEAVERAVALARETNAYLDEIIQERAALNGRDELKTCKTCDTPREHVRDGVCDLCNRRQQIMLATRGLSPECVAACVEAVRAERDRAAFARQRLFDGWTEGYMPLDGEPEEDAERELKVAPDG